MGGTGPGESPGASQEHAYLLRLSDALRPLADPIEIQAVAGSA